MMIKALNILNSSWLLSLIIVLASFLDNHKSNGPNILWIYLEDTSPLMGCYGYENVHTPNIDSLASKGLLFTNAFMPAPVCSPCRSSIITGMMSTTIGAHNHHSSRSDAAAIYLPDSVRTLPELFRSNGYFTFNNGKDDYNFTYDRKALYSQPYLIHPIYGKKGEHIDLAKLKSKQPFFGQIQLPGGKEIFSSTFKDQITNPVDRASVALPPFLPDDPVVMEEYANHLDAIQLTDKKIGEILERLDQANILQNTIVFFFSDHGMRLTRHKQFLYDGGLQVPLIIADFTSSMRIAAGHQTDQLISGLDLGPTALALAKCDVPNYMEGSSIFDTTQIRSYVISTRDRCDFTIDRIRSVRSKRFKYIRNFLLDRPYVQPTYMDVDQVPFVLQMRKLAAEGRLNEAQQRFFAEDRPAEELYDLENDPNELVNLHAHDSFVDTLSRFRNVLSAWIDETGDQGQYPEEEENLKYMLGIWGDFAVNPEYEPLRQKFPDLSGSLFQLKRAPWTKVE